MTSLVIDHRDVSLDYEQDCVLVRQEGVRPRSIPMSRLQRIQCMHNTAVTTRLLGQCQARGVDFIVINSRSSQHCFAVHAQHIEQCQRRINQYRVASDPVAALPLSRRLVIHKFARSRQVLAVRTENDARDRALLAFDEAGKRARNVLVPEILRGVEGAAQRGLFEYWRSELPDHLGFRQRLRRPPPDPVNALLSLSFTLIYHEATRQCHRHGLDPWLGFYHLPSPGRRSLACDLVEPIRPLIESWVVDSFCSGEFDLRQFSVRDGQCLLGKAGRAHFYEAWQFKLGGWSKRLGHYAAVLARHLNGASAVDESPVE